ncbi:uncharacterized protein TrAtP1_004799 [Trichoderma atroviride]|uniref:uncharacterized protein n=1 Tax=Hypocrea atroviridis TaxID=63577 RepID=UPI003323FA7F|nr:hypothetical protein TrAtP1_004799 [Trichoderma atroviride]
MRKKEEYLSLISAAHLDPNSEILPLLHNELANRNLPPFFVLPLMLMIKSPKLPFRRISSRCLFSFLSRCFLSLDCLGSSRISLPLALLGGLGGPLLGARGGPVLSRGGTGTVPAGGGGVSTSEAGGGSVPVTSTGGGEGGLDGNGSLLLSASDELLLLNLLLGLGLRVTVCFCKLA